MDTETVETSPEAVEKEKEAKRMGWKPKENFTGKAEHWVDAEEYVRRGEQVLPILRHTNKELRTTVEQQATKLDELMRLNKANAMALEQLTAAQQRQAAEGQARSIEQLNSEIQQARESGDVALELSLIDQRTEAREQLRKAKEKPVVQERQQETSAAAAAPQDLTQTPDWKGFVDDNPWYTDDAAMRGACIGIQGEMISKGELSVTTPLRERLDKVAAEVKRRFRYAETSRMESKVEGGGSNASGGGGGSSKHTYADLPADAKQACDRAASQLVGPKRSYKDLSAWRKKYVEDYFS